MSLATPLWLLLLGLLPVIVILHAVALRWRNSPVSSLVFWDEILRERRTSMRIRRLLRNLSLLFELAAVAALSIALAGPRVVRTGLSGAGDTILVLDATASMQTRENGRARFDMARGRAADVLAGIRRGARMALVIAEKSPRLAVPFTDDRQAVRRALSAAEATDEPGDVDESMVFAVSLRDARRGDQVVLVTDGAFDTLESVDASLPWIHVLRVGTARENAGITALSFRRSIGGEETYEMFVALTNTGDRATTFPLTISAERTLVESRSIALPAGGTTTLAIPWKGPTAGRIEARIQTGDDFPVDDHAYAVLAPARPLRVLVEGTGTYFLERALASLPGVTVRVAEGTPALTAAPLTAPTAADTADVVVYDEVQPPPVEKGSYIFFASVPPNLPVRVAGDLSLPPVTGWSRDAPLLDSVSLGGLAIRQALDLVPGPGFAVLATSRGSPLLLSWDQAGLKALVVAFDPARSDFPLRPGFPVLLANALSWFFPSWLSVQADQVQAGSPRALPVPADGTITVETPGGARESLAATGSSIDFYNTRSTGFYRVEGGGNTSEFAVSLTSAAESSIRPRFEAGGETAEGTAKAAAPVAVPVWSALAIAALALVLAEWLVWSRTAGGARQ